VVPATVWSVAAWRRSSYPPGKPAGSKQMSRSPTRVARFQNRALVSETRREVVGWKRDLAGGVGRIDDEAALELVERRGEPAAILDVPRRHEVDVVGDVRRSVVLDRDAADEDALDPVGGEVLEQRLALWVQVACAVSHASSAARPSGLS